MSTTLTKDEFEAFVRNANNEIENAYQTLKNTDAKFARINDYQGAYQAALANSWASNYAKAVTGFSNMANAIATANQAAANIASTDAQIAASRQ